jgi:hypothetical protein
VEKPGFKRLTRDQVQVRVDTAVRADAMLEVGEVSQTMEVSAQAGLLQTESCETLLQRRLRIATSFWIAIPSSTWTSLRS